LTTRLKYQLLIIIFVSFTATTNLLGQVNAGEDVTISAGLPVQLKGQFEGYTGIAVTAQDDYFVGPFNIGFEFTYFGETYSEFAIGPNGLLSFNLPDILDVVYWTSVSIPNNVFEKTIMGPYQDLFKRPTAPHDQYIYYRSVGTQPNRKLIVGWCEAPMFGCESEVVTTQIVLNESDSTIVNHLIAKPSCMANLENRATQGVNFDDIIGVVVPDRNNASWTAQHESWQFKPDGNENYIVSQLDFKPEPIVPSGKMEWTWYKNGYPGGEMISDLRYATVHPLETTTYYCEITLCSGLKYYDDITVHVIPIPNALNPESEIDVNREFKVFAQPNDQIKNYAMYIYNRWGQQIFQTNDILEGWDGTNNGKPCNPGVYVWTIYYDAAEGTITNKGVVTLVR